MVWDATAQGGFSTAKPWLPVKPAQLAQNVAAQDGVAGSVLTHYRSMLAFRRTTPALIHGRTRFIDLPEPVLAFTRQTATETLACAFNLSPEAVTLHATGVAALIGPSQAASLHGDTLTLGANAVAFLTTTGPVTLTP